MHAHLVSGRMYENLTAEHHENLWSNFVSPKDQLCLNELQSVHGPERRQDVLRATSRPMGAKYNTIMPTLKVVRQGSGLRIDNWMQ